MAISCLMMMGTLFILVTKSKFLTSIDFGFILDISPGGINFESAPFKLTTEMIQVMGGDASSQSYKFFMILVIRGYLAIRYNVMLYSSIRPYADEIIQMVQLMAESGLPCFKGAGTLKKLRDRFQLEMTERGAAEFMLARIRESHENTRRYSIFN
jgi:phosphatidylinositol 4-kinase